VSRWARSWQLPFALALCLTGPICFDAITESDAGFHVAMGRLIRQGTIPTTNALSWIARDHPWRPTSWLYDWLCAVADAGLGPLGLQLMTFAFLALTLLFMSLLCKRAGPQLGAWLVIPIALALVPRITLRPHVPTWAVIAATLYLCHAAPRLRFFCLPIIALGANLHAGAAFAAGIAGLFFLQEFFRGRRGLALLGMAGCLAATLATPNGLYGVTYLFAHLTVSSVMPVREFAHASWPGSAAFFVAAALSLLLLSRRPSKEPALLAALVVFAGLTLLAARMSSEFMLVAAPVLASGLDELAERASLRAALAALFGAVFVVIFPMRLDARYRYLDLAPRFDEHALPVRAARFIAERSLDGPHFNSFDDGGYLEYALPGLPAFLDGRIQAFPASLFHQLEDSERSPAAFDQELRQLGVEWALVLRDPRLQTGDGLLDPMPGWALVYWDDLSELFVRRDVKRLGSLIERDEYRFFRADGAVLGRIAAANRSALPAIEAEVSRYERTSEQDPNAALVRCELALRGGSAGTEACDRAAALARGDRLRQLLSQVRTVQAAP